MDPTTLNLILLAMNGVSGVAGAIVGRFSHNAAGVPTAQNELIKALQDTVSAYKDQVASLSGELAAERDARHRVETELDLVKAQNVLLGKRITDLESAVANFVVQTRKAI